MKALPALLISQAPSQTPKPSLAPPSQRNGAIIKAVNRETENLIVRIGGKGDSFTQQDQAVLENFSQRIENIRKSSTTPIKTSLAHTYIENIANANYLMLTPNKQNVTGFLEAQTHIDSTLPYHDSEILSIAAYQKGSGIDLLAYFVMQLKKNSGRILELFSIGNRSNLSYINKQYFPCKTGDFYQRFGFLPDITSEGEVTLDLTQPLNEYTQERIARLETKNIDPAPFPLPQNLGLEDGNGIDYST
jgi:hypothetical protein